MSQSPVDIHFQALCNAVEHEKLEKARSIVENQSHLNLNAINGDGFTPLDLSFMTGNQKLLNYLAVHGAEEGRAFPSPESISAHLLSLVTESRKQVDKFGQLVKAANSGGSAAHLSQTQLKECEKQQSLWQKRLTTLKKMRSGFDASGCPHAPIEVHASVIGPTSILVRLTEPEKIGHSLYTKFRVQWSHTDTFAKIAGEITVTNIRYFEYSIEDLTEGQRYFIRASFGNPKGFGPFSASVPKSLVPSSWRRLEDMKPRIEDQLEICSKVLDQLLENHSDDSIAHFRSAEAENEDFEQLPNQSQKLKRKGILHLFSSAPKFQRNLGRKLYLCCVLFHEDKVLMTNEECLPTVEIDDEFPSNLQTEFVWFSKICFLWNDIQKLKQQMARISGASNFNFRLKLLQAITAMQTALGIYDLGSVYFRPFQNNDGSVIFSLVNHIRQPKNLVTLSLKWVPLSKAQRRISLDFDAMLERNANPMDALKYSIREQILFHQVSGLCLNRGLYVCYLQTQSSIDTMRVVVSNTSPSVLPYSKVRDNPHVTCDEWEWLHRLGRATHNVSSMAAPSPTTNFLAGEGEEGSDVYTLALKNLRPTESQYAFGIQLQGALSRLFDYLDLKEEDRKGHRVFDREVIELGPDVSVIIVIPPAEVVCSVAENKPFINLQRNDLMTIPLQVYELIHMTTYFRKVVSSYCRVSALLDVDLVLAKQLHREAFSNEELEYAQTHLNALLDHQQSLEESWKNVRWILDVLSTGRNKSAWCGIDYNNLSEWYANQKVKPDDTQFSCGNYNTPARSANVQKLDTYSNYEGRHHHLTRTPTTRSDPLEFNVSSSNNKENEVHNFPEVRLPHSRGRSSRLVQSAEGSQNSTPGHSGTFAQQQLPSVGSLNFSHSTNSLDSIDNANKRQHCYHDYENVYNNSSPPPPVRRDDSKRTASTSNVRSYDPRVAQAGIFSNVAPDVTLQPEPNILQVYAAYDSGLASGTSVKIHVTDTTSAREVVDLVIKQLNMAVILKGKDGPIYDNDKLKNFCLVAVIGSRERCLRDDFRPLHLQNPWRKGKLFVRMKNDLLAAIEQISRHTTTVL